MSVACGFDSAGQPRARLPSFAAAVHRRPPPRCTSDGRTANPFDTVSPTPWLQPTVPILAPIVAPEWPSFGALQAAEADERVEIRLREEYAVLRIKAYEPAHVPAAPRVSPGRAAHPPAESASPQTLSSPRAAALHARPAAEPTGPPRDSPAPSAAPPGRIPYKYPAYVHTPTPSTESARSHARSPLLDRDSPAPGPHAATPAAAPARPPPHTHSPIPCTRTESPAPAAPASQPHAHAHMSTSPPAAAPAPPHVESPHRPTGFVPPAQPAARSAAHASGLPAPTPPRHVAALAQPSAEVASAGARTPTSPGSPGSGAGLGFLCLSAPEPNLKSLALVNKAASSHLPGLVQLNWAAVDRRQLPHLSKLLLEGGGCCCLGQGWSVEPPPVARACPRVALPNKRQEQGTHKTWHWNPGVDHGKQPAFGDPPLPPPPPVRAVCMQTACRKADMQEVLALTVPLGCAYSAHQFASCFIPTPLLSDVSLSGCNPLASVGACVKHGNSTNGSACTFALLTLLRPPPPPHSPCLQRQVVCSVV